MILHIVLRQDATPEQIDAVSALTGMAGVNERLLKVFSIMSGEVADDFDTTTLAGLPQVTSVEVDSDKG